MDKIKETRRAINSSNNPACIASSRGFSKQANIVDIRDRLKEIKRKKEKLLLLRKEEIFAILEYSGGLELSNELLAGIAIYANNPEHKDSKILEELRQLGQEKIPSKFKG